LKQKLQQFTYNQMIKTVMLGTWWRTSKAANYRTWWTTVNRAAGRHGSNESHVQRMLLISCQWEVHSETEGGPASPQIKLKINEKN